MAEEEKKVDPTPEAKWYDGQPAEVIGHLQSKGWHDKPANEVAIAAVVAHREAQKFIGQPPEQLLRLPKDATDQAGWDAVWQRLGAVKEAKDVDLSALKRADGTALDPAMTDMVGNLATRARLTKDAALEVAKDLVQFMDKQRADSTQDQVNKLALEKDALAKNWGNNQAANLVVAQNAARVLGIDADAINALEKVAGYSKVMEMFRMIGTKIGEDRFVSGGNGPNPGVMTTEQAKAKLQDLQNDGQWRGRYLNGGTNEKTEFMNLTRIIAGV